jgi:DNA-binding MarR family transcriptional regulator
MAKACEADARDVEAPPTMEDISTSIWQLTEEILELFRSMSSGEVHKRKRPDLLWLDDLTETQANTVIAVRQLCDLSPEGITLKKLAETIGVTPAAASVMVDLLVKKKMLKRTRSKSDRRSILIRVAPETSALFEISEGTLRQSVVSLTDSLGEEMLYEWQRILLAAAAALRELVGARTPETSEPSAADPDGEIGSALNESDGIAPGLEVSVGGVS